MWLRIGLNLLFVVLLWGIHPLSLVAGNLPTVIWRVPGVDATGQAIDNPVLLPDWSGVSFGSLPPIESSGSFDGTPYISQTGYDLSRSWSAGDPPDKYLKLADVANALMPQLFSLSAIAAVTNLDLSQTSIDSFVIVKEQTLTQLVAAVPGLGSQYVSQVPPVSALLQSKGQDLPGFTIDEAIAYTPVVAAAQLKDIDTTNFGVQSIPNLTGVPLQNFSNWESIGFIKDVPGLKDVPLSSMPSPLTAVGNLVMRIDMIYGVNETKRQNTISGSDVAGFSVPCQGGKCGYVELTNLKNDGSRAASDGYQWISGKYQLVRGGWGCLKAVNGGKEPTGRMPFGDAVKVVIMDTDETTDTVRTALFFRYCGICGCTPYFIGPVPFFDYRGDSNLFVGELIDLGSAGSSHPTSASPLGVPKSGPRPVPPKSVPKANSSLPYPVISGSLYPTMAGVNVYSLTAAISQLESSGNQTEVGPYVVADGGLSRGRALGEYQVMSYEPQLIAAVSATPGGQSWLNQLSDPSYQPTAAQVLQYFPVTVQSQLVQILLQQKIGVAAAEIDPTTGQLFSGDRLVARVGQIYYGGDAAAIDSNAGDPFNNQVSIFQYGLNAVQKYRQQLHSKTPLSAVLAAALEQRLNSSSSVAMVNCLLSGVGLPSLSKTEFLPDLVQALSAQREIRNLAETRVGDLVAIDGGKGRQDLGFCLIDGCKTVGINASGRFTVVSRQDWVANFPVVEQRVFRLEEAA